MLNVNTFLWVMLTFHSLNVLIPAFALGIGVRPSAPIEGIVIRMVVSMVLIVWIVAILVSRQ